MTSVSSAIDRREFRSGAESRRGSASLLLKVWLAYGAWCGCSGWILSLIHQLNPLGYAVDALLTVFIGGIVLWRSRLAIFRSFPRQKLSRFTHPFSLIYLLCLAGSIVGGVLHAPNNYDMLTYRIPRMLNWLSDGRWHWINGYVDRMNYSGTGWEWMAMPLLIFSRGTGLFFLINIVSYLLLPGLFFSFLRGVGVNGRMAWAWMWILPAGLNFVMQAGGGANDTLAAVFFLASMFFAFRARRSQKISDLSWSMIAAALLTACKSSNLPLALPCVVAIIPSLRLLKPRLIAGAMVMSIAILCSLLPTLLLNYRYTRDFAGSPDDPAKLKIHNPLAGLLGNTLQLTAANLQPPVMPMAEKWNQFSKHILPGSINRFLDRDFPRFTLHMGELPQEEQAGLGIGLTLLAAVSLVATVIGNWRWRSAKYRPWMGRASVLIAGYLAMLVFMAMLGSEAAARLASPYYPILIAPLLLHPINYTLARSRWWNICAILACLAVLPGLILTPSRPLFPAEKWTSALANRYPNSRLVRRASVVYAVYAQRAQNLAPLLKFLPDDAKVIGLIGSSDSSESPLWKLPGQPLGTRRVIELLPGGTRAQALAQGIRYVVTGADGLDEQGSSLHEFLATYRGKVIGHEKIIIKVTEGAEDWYVVDLK